MLRAVQNHDFIKVRKDTFLRNVLSGSYYLWSEQSLQKVSFFPYAETKACKYTKLLQSFYYFLIYLKLFSHRFTVLVL